MVTSPPIGQALPARTFDRTASALGIVNPELDAVRTAEIEFGEVTVRMLLAAALVDPGHPALEDTEEAFCAVHMGFTTRPFLNYVIYAAVSRKAPSDSAVGMAFVGHQFAAGIGVVEHSGAKSARLQIVHFDRSSRAAIAAAASPQPPPAIR